MKAIIDYSPVCKGVEDLIRKRLKKLKLVKTGALLESIEVSFTNGSFKISALDYFEYLDEKHDISYYVFNSDEFVNLMGDLLQREIDKKIKL